MLELWGPYHSQQHWKYPAKGTTCSKCGKNGNYARLCQGGAPGPVSASAKISILPLPRSVLHHLDLSLLLLLNWRLVPVSASAKISNSTLAKICAASLDSLSETNIAIKVGTYTAQALIDSGRFYTFISDAWVKQYNLPVSHYI